MPGWGKSVACSFDQWKMMLKFSFSPFCLFTSNCSLCLFLVLFSPFECFAASFSRWSGFFLFQTWTLSVAILRSSQNDCVSLSEGEVVFSNKKGDFCQELWGRKIEEAEIWMLLKKSEKTAKLYQTLYSGMKKFKTLQRPTSNMSGSCNH